MALPELPDWAQGVQLIGKDPSGDPVLIAVDADGQLYALLKGYDGTVYRPLKVDTDGQLYALIKGSGGEDVAVDVNGFFSVIMKGDDAGTLRTIAVDPSGKILGVFQGVYDSTLKTLQCDADGRLIAILTDPEDVYGTFRQMGLAELASRIGSIVTFDRRGDVIYLEDFEKGIAHWAIGGVGTGYEVVLSTSYVRSGAYSVKMTGGSTSARVAQLTRKLPYQVKGLMGMEAHIAFASDIETAKIWYYIYDGTNESNFALQLDPVNDELNYLDSGFGWTKLADLRIDLLSDPPFIPVKMVFDTVNDEYVRAIVNGEETSMAGIAAWTSALAAMKYNYILVEVTSTPGNNGIIYVDDIIVTQSEPA